MRYDVTKNYDGAGWYVRDTTTGQSVAWVYDQRYGYKHPEEDERRVKLFADVLNGVIKLQEE